MDINKVNHIILASSSPRRIELLNNCKIRYQVVPHKFDEDSIQLENPKKLVQVLAKGKALSIAEQNDYQKEYILGVDTIVVLKKKVLGKPRNVNEAEKMVRSLSGRSHQVMSGLSLVNHEKSVEINRVAVSKVKIALLNEKFIQFYLDNMLWEGYAGGYAIQSLFGMFVQKIKGSYSNIVGLPVSVLTEMLKEINYDFLW